MALSDTASQTSCNWFRVGLAFELMLQVEKFRCSFPFRTSRSMRMETPGRRLYQGHCVWLVWQSRQARVMMGRKFSGTARSPPTVVFVWECEIESSEASPPHTTAAVKTAVLSLTRRPLFRHNQLHAHVVVSTTAFHRALHQILRWSVRSFHVVILGSVIKTQVPALIAKRSNHKTVGGTVPCHLGSTLRSDTQPQRLSRVGADHGRFLVQDAERVIARREDLDHPRFRAG